MIEGDGYKMVVDFIDNASIYYGLHKHMKEAFEFAKTLVGKPVGRYDYTGLDEGTLYAMVQEGDTNPIDKSRVENHQNYLDIQIMLDGAEEMGYEVARDLSVTIPYDGTKDIAFFEASDKLSMITISKDMFYIVYPDDGHMPCRHSKNAKHYRKMVVKLKLV